MQLTSSILWTWTVWFGGCGKGIGFAFFSLLPVLLADGDVLQHVLGGAQGDGSPLVDGLGLDVQDGLEAGGGHAARLLHDVSHGVAFVQQPQL